MRRLPFSYTAAPMPKCKPPKKEKQEELTEREERLLRQCVAVQIYHATGVGDTALLAELKELRRKLK